MPLDSVLEISPPLTPKLKHIYQWSKDEIVKRVLELEDELMEFQESSRELEKALEEELQTLEQTNEMLLKQDKTKSQTIKDLNDKIKSLKRQMNQMSDNYNHDKIKLENEIRAAKQRVVDIEITNDTMELKDRLISNKLEGLNLFNMELLEKVALLENDLHLERKRNNEKDLHIMNYKNRIIDLKAQIDIMKGMKYEISKQKDDSDSEVDILVLSMKAMLKAGPPTPLASLPKSGSRQKVHDLILKTDDLTGRFKDLKRDSMYLASTPAKSRSTTQLSKSGTAAKPETFEKSKTSRDISKMLLKEAGLEPVAASPVASSKSRESKKSTKTEIDAKKKKKVRAMGWFRS